MQRLVLALIHGYRLVLSPYIGQHCRFHPSCSCYTEEAILKYGVIKGLWLGSGRLCRCHPLREGGLDPVP